MESNIIQIVYVIKSTNRELAEIKLLDFVMDFNGNIICWKTKENAEKFIINNGFEGQLFIVKTKINEINNELNLKNCDNGVRLIDTIEF